MRGEHFGVFTAIGAAMLAIATSAQAQSQQGLQQQIEHALRPIPKVLQGESRGLPTRSDSLTIVNLGPAAAPPAPQGSPYYANRSRGPVWRSGAVAIFPARGCPPIGDLAGKKGASLPQIDFEFGSAQLKPEAIDTLRKLGKALNEGLSDQKLFQIQGHTDAVGSFDYNKNLSAARAQAVNEYLVKVMGVADSRLQTVGVGYCNLMNPLDPYGAENRTVVIVNLEG